MLLVDTNVLAYLLIEGKYTSTAQQLHRLDPDWHSEFFILDEFTNVLISHLRTGSLPMSVCRETLAEAEKVMGMNLHEVTNWDVLAAAGEFGISAYDAHYIVLAQKFNTPLVTEDSKLRTAAPKWTLSIDSALKQFQ